MSRTAGLILVVVAVLLLAAWDSPDVYISHAGNDSSRAAQPDPVIVKLNWFPSVQYLGFYVAQDKGYYADENLDVTFEERLPGDDNNPQKVVDGLYDFGVGGALAYSQSNGAAVTVIASILQFGPEAFFARADSGIVAPADLAGRTVAVKSSGWELLLTALLEREGLTLDDITPVEAGFDMTPFLDGEVEVWGGFLTDEVVRARLAGLDLVTLPLYEYGIDTSAMVVYTSTERLEADPDLAVRFLRASLRGWEWALDHPTEAVDMMLEMYPDLAEEREFHEISFDATMPLVRPPGSRLGAIDCDDWVAQSILDEMESTDGLCTTTILESLWADD